MLSVTMVVVGRSSSIDYGDGGGDDNNSTGNRSWKRSVDVDIVFAHSLRLWPSIADIHLIGHCLSSHFARKCLASQETPSEQLVLR